MGKETARSTNLLKNPDTFSPVATDETFKINKGPLNCNSKKFVYLSECKKCKNPHVGKALTKFRMRLNNYKSAHKFFKIKKPGTETISGSLLTG